MNNISLHIFFKYSSWNLKTDALAADANDIQTPEKKMTREGKGQVRKRPSFQCVCVKVEMHALRKCHFPISSYC